ncbi:SDR family NAD(P)-dependent oxidoreductase [Sphingobium sp. AP49]|uniref:SDR family NAD(P)-dependent oxidoreductase n=1 Tax=Sphingobium sp. AP49 TaxID=1144307 RepID=UPI00026ED0FF|nr:SDR family NAD(P)-dependent oxidoreductase [Sphingobium sp. AP49]WHO37305.1 SDR family NAD(P)-dependent oxidoreductase [Sphingobium sp. AP49]
MVDIVARYGPWAVVAGASEGTGRAFAAQLAAQGMKLILLARREAPLAALAADLAARHDAQCLWASVDLAAGDAADRVTQLCGDREIGLFISNAGADPHGTHFLDSEIDDWSDLVGRNVATTMRLCHQFGRDMRARRRGGIILVGSGACYGGAAGLGVYAGTKAFDLCLGEALWAELRAYGVDVLNLILSRTDTPELRRFLASRGAALPAGLASPEEVARIGLQRLPHGPVHHWGLADDEQGYAPLSAAARRARILAIEQAMRDLQGAGA